MNSTTGFRPDFVAGLAARRLTSGGALYRAKGSGPPVLFVHGAYHGAWCFGTWMKRAGELDVAAAAIDLPGHGLLASDGLPPSTGVDDYATSIAEAAALLGREVTIVGHSLGALAVAKAAAQIEAAGFVLLAPSPPGNLPGAARVPLVPEGQPLAPPSRDESIRRYFADRDFSWSDAYCRLLCAESPTAMNDRYALRVRVEPAPLSGKTLVISAGRDDAARHPEGQDAAIARLYNAEYRTLNDAPHCMMAPTHADADAALAAVLDWRRRPRAMPATPADSTFIDEP